MKKFAALTLILLLCFCGVFGAFVPQAISASFDNSNFEQSAVYNNWLDFVTAHPSRVAGTDGESVAADFLKAKFVSMGYADAEDSQTVPVFQSDAFGNQKTVYSRNIVAKKTFSNSTKQVIIGAHYDNVEEGNGAFDNGSGIAVLLTLAQRISLTTALPFDIVFVAFGAEEVGLSGSYEYVSKMTQSEKDKTLLMINIDVVGFGDYTYIFGEDIANPQENFFTDISQQLYAQDAVKKMPFNRATQLGFGLRPYFHIGHASDHFPFLENGIPVAFFFSGNLESRFFGYVEKEGSGGAVNIMHTASDTATFIKQYGAEFANKLEVVAETIFNGITDASFVSAVEDARNFIVNPFWLNPMFAYVIYAVLVVVIVALCFVYYRKLLKQSIIGTAEIRIRDVKKPSEDDIFKFNS